MYEESDEVYEPGFSCLAAIFSISGLAKKAKTPVATEDDSGEKAANFEDRRRKKNT